MKKYILTSLLTLFAYIVSYGQISGSVKWEQNVDFFIQIGDEYTEISIESMCYTEEVGSPKLPYCVKSFVLPDNAKAPMIKVATTSRQLIGENLLIIPAQYPTPIGEDYSSWTEPNSEVYNSL